MYSNHYNFMRVSLERKLKQLQIEYKQQLNEIKKLASQIHKMPRNTYLEALYEANPVAQNEQKKPSLDSGEIEMEDLRTRGITTYDEQKTNHLKCLIKYLNNRRIEEGIDEEQIRRAGIVIELLKTLENDDIKTELELLNESKICGLKGITSQQMYNLLVARRSELTGMALTALKQNSVSSTQTIVACDMTWINSQKSLEEIDDLKNKYDCVFVRCAYSNRNQAYEYSTQLMTYLEERGKRHGLDEEQIRRISLVTNLLNHVQRNNLHDEFSLLEEEKIEPLKGIRTQRLYDILVERRDFLLESAKDALEIGIATTASAQMSMNPGASCSH